MDGVRKAFRHAIWCITLTDRPAYLLLTGGRAAPRIRSQEETSLIGAVDSSPFPCAEHVPTRATCRRYLMVYAPRVFACLVLSLTGDGFAQTTWVVDAAQGPGWNFTDIPSAVTAASDGDIIRIRAGSYSWFSVTNKGLRIIGDGSASVVIGGAGTVTLQGTSANQKLWLQGMRFAMTSATFPPTVNVLSTRGEVVLRDLDFGVAAGPGPARWSRLVLRSCAQVHLMDSSILGGFAHTRSILSAVDAQDTFLQISHCTLIGASTADPSGSGTPGSPGVEINRGDLFLTASTVRGGGGAPGCLLTGMPAGQGGAAITGRGGATVVVCGVPSNCIVEGGRGGSDCSPLRPDPSGPGIQLVGGSARFEGVTPGPRVPAGGPWTFPAARR